MLACDDLAGVDCYCGDQPSCRSRAFSMVVSDDEDSVAGRSRPVASCCAFSQKGTVLAASENLPAADLFQDAIDLR